MKKNYLSNFKFISKLPWIFIPIIFIFSIYQYNSIIKDFKKEQEKTESHLLNSLYVVDEAYAMFEKALESELEENMNSFLLAYKKSDKQVEKIDLEQLKKSFSKDIDLYIISKDNIVLYSTFKEDINLNFNKWKSFVPFLDRVRSSLKFEPQRITVETSTGLLKKYVYQSTFDGEYVFQLGLSSKAFLKYVDKLDFVKISKN